MERQVLEHQVVDTADADNVRLFTRSPGHYIEWIQACKGQGPPPGSNFLYSGWVTESNRLGNVAYRTGKKLEWDHHNLSARNAPEADQFIRRPYRKGWDSILG